MEEQTQPKEAEPSKKIIIPKKAIALAKSVGIDLNIIVGEFQRLNERVENTEKAITILAETNEKLMPLVELAQRAKAMRQAQSEGTPSEGKGFSLRELLPYLLGGGGGGMDEEMMNLNKEMMRANISRMKKSLTFIDTIEDLIKSKVATKIVAEALT